ncbi:hypothetical protein ACWGCC_18780 [Streptomyces nigrescens]
MLYASGTGTLTDRYVAEVVRRIPADQRGDVADELRATIADTVEARGPADPEPPSARWAATVGGAWTPDDLPERRVPKKRGAAAYAGVVSHALLIALIVWQHTAQPYRTDGGIRLDVLDPGLWSGWIWPILAGLVGLVTLDAIRAVRVWTRALAVWSACAEAAFALPLAWVLHRQEFFSPDFLSDVNGGWQTPDSF